MSGGVDSSVAAYLMVKEGYDCAGATLKLYDNPQCSFRDTVPAAPHLILKMPEALPHDLECSITSSQCMMNSVTASLTNLRYLSARWHTEPCIDCNRFLKFSALLDKARELGCEYIASGHYARREQDPETGRFILKKGLDPTKDQSYVLYAMTQDQLAHTLFPLGIYTKKEIRTLPRNRALSMQINRTVRISASYRTENMLPLLNSIRTVFGTW